MATTTRHEITASVTERGQVTIPAEVRRILGIGARGKVQFVVEGEQIVLKRPKYTIETAFGSIKPREPLDGPEDWEARIREAKDERAGELEKRLREGTE